MWKADKILNVKKNRMENFYFFVKKIHFEMLKLGKIDGFGGIVKGFQIANTTKNMKFEAKTRSEGSSNLSVCAQTL